MKKSIILLALALMMMAGCKKDSETSPRCSVWRRPAVMIADPTKTVIVEFTGIEGSKVIYTEYPIMTNFYNFQYEFPI